MDTHGRILIVEDEEKIARFLELELTHEGYEVGKAADGRSALDMALASTWDLILLDVMLPQLNGLEVLRRLPETGVSSGGRIGSSPESAATGSPSFCAKAVTTESRGIRFLVS